MFGKTEFHILNGDFALALWKKFRSGANLVWKETYIEGPLPQSEDLHIFRNALQAMENSLWPMLSGIAECACRIIMSKVVINWIGNDSLFISEPVAWAGALFCVLFPYLYYSKKMKE